LKKEPSFLAGCLLELALLVLALLWGRLSHRATLSGLHWSVQDALHGIGAAIPPFVFFLWTLNAKVRAFAAHRRLLESLLLPLLRNWALSQLAIISILAGLCEEALFRGALQGSLAERVGVALALVLSSATFGAAHLVTWTYAIIAAFIGAYLGFLWIWTGNLLTPMVTHAVYDLAALIYFLRAYRPRS
jgi:uncharacterized protein